MDDFGKKLVRQLRKVRNFPTNTCPYSRHAQMIGENLIRQNPYPMLQEEPEHCGGSILATVLALYEARIEIERLTELVSDYERIIGKVEPGTDKIALPQGESK